MEKRFVRAKKAFGALAFVVQAREVESVERQKGELFQARFTAERLSIGRSE
jgi:hypothetical protein